jgi:GTPase Era involved in 16S rRNA processing
VGSQKNNRKKWFDYFENVSVVLFVVPMDQYEFNEQIKGQETCALLDSLKFFNEISVFFADRSTPMVLIFNKKDAFQEKIKHMPLKAFFKDYTGKKLILGVLKFQELNTKKLAAISRKNF